MHDHDILTVIAVGRTDRQTDRQRHIQVDIPG